MFRYFKAMETFVKKKLDLVFNLYFEDLLKVRSELIRKLNSRAYNDLKLSTRFFKMSPHFI